MIRDFSPSNSLSLPVFWRESDLIALYSLLGRLSPQLFSGMSLNEAFWQLLMTVLYCWKERMFPDWNRFLLGYWSIKSMPNDCWRHSQRVKRALALITLTIPPELTLRWKKYFETAHRESNPLQSSDWTFQTLKSLGNFTTRKSSSHLGWQSCFSCNVRPIRAVSCFWPFVPERKCTSTTTPATCNHFSIRRVRCTPSSPAPAHELPPC